MPRANSAAVAARSRLTRRAPYAASCMTVRSVAAPITTSHPARRHAGITCAKLYMAVPGGVHD